MSTGNVQTVVVARQGTPSRISTSRVRRATCGHLSLCSFGSSND